VQRVEDVGAVERLGEGSHVAGTVTVVGGGDQPEAMPTEQAVDDERARHRRVGVLAERALGLVVAAAGLEDLDQPAVPGVVVVPVVEHHG
jgi:hypothetical protein